MGTIESVTCALRRALRDAYHLARPCVTVMRGAARVAEEHLIICYVGHEPRGYRLGFPSQALSTLDEEVDLGPRWVWQLRQVLESQACDFAVVELPRVLGQSLQRMLVGLAPSLFLPFFVHTIVRTSDIPALLRGNKNLRNDIRLARKAGYRLEVANGADDFREFLECYHVPYLAAAHGRLASVFDYGFLGRPDYKQRGNWELLKVMRGDAWVAGALARKGGGTAYSMEVGIRGGKNTPDARGALAAAYWFFVERMGALGFPEVSFMWSPPFLENGVLRFKRKYRPRLEAAPSGDRGLLLVDVGRNLLTSRTLMSLSGIQLSGSELKATRFIRDRGELATARKGLAAECASFSGIREQEVLVLKALGD